LKRGGLIHVETRPPFPWKGKGVEHGGVALPLLQYRGSRPGHFNRLRTGEARQKSRRASLPPPLFPVLTLGGQLVGIKSGLCRLLTMAFFSNDEDRARGSPIPQPVEMTKASHPRQKTTGSSTGTSEGATQRPLSWRFCKGLIPDSPILQYSITPIFRKEESRTWM
jgi:hypothetical protein